MTDTTGTENAPNWFSKLNSINVNEKVEKKNGFSYLSWAWAHARMAELDPDFDWWPHDFDGLPYLKTPGGCMVKVTVRFQGKERSHLFPVLDHRNKPIAEPTVFDINTSIMRAMVKCCALFGLGLYIYAGEDLPEGEAEAQHRREVEDYAKKVQWTLEQDKDEDALAAECFALHSELNAKGAEFYADVGSAMGSSVKAAFKKFITMHRKGIPTTLPNGRAA